MFNHLRYTSFDDIRFITCFLFTPIFRLRHFAHLADFIGAAWFTYVNADDVLVLQHIGPKGAPGMPEAGYLPIPRKLARAGVKIDVLSQPRTAYAGKTVKILTIGKKGSDIEKLRKTLGGMTSSDVSLNIVEIRKPELDATLVAESIAQQLERRVAFRRAMKRAVQSAMRLGAEGIRINCSGRLGGAEIARMEWYREGRVPLHTLRADVDYGVATAFTTFGTCGVKVWIFKGEILEHDPMAQDKRMAEGDSGRPSRRDAA